MAGSFKIALFNDLQAVSVKSDDGLRRSGQKDHLPHSEIQQDLRAHAIFAQPPRLALIRRVGGRGAETFCNRRAVGLADEHHNARAVMSFQRGDAFFDQAAAAAHGAQNILSEADLVHAHQHWLVGAHFTARDRHVLHIIDEGAEDRQAERPAPARCDFGVEPALDKAVMLAAIGDEVGDGADLEA